jgi:DNA-directed RNA polymerase specialized sigma24 family protein
MPSIEVGEQAAPSNRVDLGPDGVWRYSGTSIAAVGAQERTLADVLRVREVGVAGSPPEAVLFALSEIVANHRLNWVLQAGTRLRGGEEDLFSVPWPVWQERAAEPVDVWLPERDAQGLDRRLAITERELRFLREASDAATARRSQLVLLGTELGMTRRQIAEVLGLSAGRVQQLHEEVDDQHAAEVQRTISDARLLLKHVNDGLHPDRLDIPSGWTREKLDDVLGHLVDFGLLEVIEAGDELRVTETGKRVTREATAKGRAHSAKKGVRSGA